VKDILTKGLLIPPTLTLRVILYGELMCNARYDYSMRALVNRWWCFGARVWIEPANAPEKEEEEEEVEDATGGEEPMERNRQPPRKFFCSSLFSLLLALLPSLSFFSVLCHHN